MASSRIRPRMPCTSPKEPSAVWAMLMPSAALRSATEYERICDFMPSLIARPAASSAAELTRKPLDSLAKLPIRAFWLLARRDWASSDETLVWILIAMTKNDLLLGEVAERLRRPVRALLPVSNRERGSSPIL